MTVVISREKARGCGFRKPSAGGVGIYLVGPGYGEPCGKFPLPLDVCPCCHAGIKPSRSWTWIVPSQLFASAPECKFDMSTSFNKKKLVTKVAQCTLCPVGKPPEGRHGLLWIGESFYDTPGAFMREAAKMGVSRKISAVPKDFKLGETWVYLAHRFAVQNFDDGKMTAGVFTVFKPTGVDLVIDDENDVPERATKLAEQIGDGARIVRVERDEMQQMELPVAP